MTGYALDEALERFAATGPEFGPGLSNYGPMASEALVALGRDDAVLPWAEWYQRRLQDHPRSANRIESSEWREALGDIRRVADWEEFLRRELQEHAWKDVLETWVRRLSPGIMAGATHGIIRAAHAVRSLDRAQTDTRTHELAEALAYWAARYQELPSAPITTEPQFDSVSEALAAVPLVEPAARTRGLIFDAVRAVDPESFAPAINYIAVDAARDSFVSDITRVFVRQYLANADLAAISFIHCVTAPSALRMLAPHLTPATTRNAMRYAWQSCAAIYSAYGRSPSPLEPAGDVHGIDVDDLIDRAVASRDEHAIKFTEACIRENRISGDLVFFTAAEDAVRRLSGA